MRNRRARLGRSEGFPFAPVAVFVVVGLVIVGLVVLAVQESTRFEAHCRTLGGHVKTITTTTTGYTYGKNGTIKPVTATSSTTLCLSATGGILDTE